jgi:hypothetical protein
MILLPLGIALTGCTPPDTATWRTDTDTAAGAGETGDETEGEEDEEDWEEEQAYGKTLWGYLEGDEGLTGFYFFDDEADGEVCDLDYAAKWVTTSECTDCIESWVITRGAAEVWVNVDGACEAEGWVGLEGTSFGVGYNEDSLWADLGKGWVAIEEADGEREDDFAFFEIFLAD